MFTCWEVKNEALEAFKQYKVEIGNQLGKRIKVVRNDEYNGLFEKMCFQFEIIYQTIAPYSPQSNWVVERKSRTLKEMMNVMLISSGSP